MSSDYQSPEGYVNPVPEPGEPSRRPNLERARSVGTTPIPWTSSISAFNFVRLMFGLIAVVFVFAGPIRQAISDRFGIGEGSVAANGTVDLGAGAVTASYTPSGNQRATEAPHNGAMFSGQEWTLSEGAETISVRDYRFSSSPVKSNAERAGYYAASGREFLMNAGHDVAARPITRDGRDGRIWKTRGDTGSWLVLAEFPGHPVTARIRCSASSRESVVASQCMEVIDSLQFKD